MLDDIDLKFKLATSGVGENFAEDLASGARRPQRASGYSLLKQVCLSALWILPCHTGSSIGSSHDILDPEEHNSDSSHF